MVTDLTGLTVPHSVGAVNGTNVTAVTTTTVGPSTSSLPVTSFTFTANTTITSSATSTYPTPPAPTRSGTTSECTDWYTIESGDGCDTIELAYSITLAELQAWNTYIDVACDNLWADTAVCVDGSPVTPTTTTLTSTTTTSTGQGTPTPTQSGMVSGCTDFYEAQSGDDCDAIAQEYNITMDQFEEWNSAVGSSCSGLWVGYWYCVDI